MDITMCTGEGCPLSDRCYRCQAMADPLWQSYFVRPPYDGKKCDEYWEMSMDRWEAIKTVRRLLRAVEGNEYLKADYEEALKEAVDCMEAIEIQKIGATNFNNRRHNEMAGEGRVIFMNGVNETWRRGVR